MVLVNPGDAQSVQDQFVVQTKLGRIKDGLPRPQDFEILHYAPELMPLGAGEFVATGL